MAWLNLILLNVLWFASVLGAANQIIWPSALCLMLLLSVLFIYQKTSVVDLKLIGFSLLFGSLLDGYLHTSGLVLYASGFVAWGLLPPIWILFLWIGFGASINVGMQWMINRPLLGALCITTGAPLSYYSASKLDAVAFDNTIMAMGVIAVAWLAYFMAVLMLLNTKEVVADAVVQ